MPEGEQHRVEALLAAYVHHKQQLLVNAGSKRVFDVDRAMSIMRPRIEEMAAVVANWDVRPDVLMDAVFARARRDKHPDGPMPNMLKSPKYLTGALSYYLQVPYDAAAERRSMSLFLERMDHGYDMFRKDMARLGVTDLTTAGSYPIEFRYLACCEDIEMDAAHYLAPELLSTMDQDPRVKLWMEHKGMRMKNIAAGFNQWRRLQEAKSGS